MGLPDLDAAGWIMVLSAAACIGIAKAGLGGVAMVSILLMAQVFQPRESTGIQLSMLIVGDLFAVIAYRRHAQWRVIGQLLPVAGFGIACGFLIMPMIPDARFGPLIGWTTLGLLLLTVLQMAGLDFLHAAARSRAAACVAGWLGGVTTMVANAAGPVMTVYLLARRLPKMEFVGTAAWFFFFVNLAKIPFSASMGLVNAQSIALAAAVSPVILGGAFAGKWILASIRQRPFEIILLVLTFAGAIRLILKG